MNKGKAKVPDFVRLGQTLLHLLNPGLAEAKEYRKTIDEFVALLEECELPASRAAAKRLENARVWHYSGVPGANIDATAAMGLRTIAETISETIKHELAGRELIYADADVPKNLIELEKNVRSGKLQDYQKALLDDTIECLRARLYRPAIVAAWALGYDVVRQWVFEDTNRLQEFNALLGQRTQNSRGGVRSISDYEDFFREKESFVLEVLRDATGALNGFTQKHHRDLQNLLDTRNDFAHANFYLCTEMEAKAYIDRIVRIVTSAPFN